MSNLLRFFVFLFAITSLTGCQAINNKSHQQTPRKNHWAPQISYNISGNKICQNNRLCNDDEQLPHRPCSEPMPTYYNNVNLSDGDILLIQPYSRTIVACYDLPNQSAYGCAEKFQREGFVLITDIPQAPAKYDTIKEGNYPTRKWGGHQNQTAPRW